MATLNWDDIVTITTPLDQIQVVEETESSSTYTTKIDATWNIDGVDVNLNDDIVYVIPNYIEPIATIDGLEPTQVPVVDDLGARIGTMQWEPRIGRIRFVFDGVSPGGEPMVDLIPDSRGILTASAMWMIESTSEGGGTAEPDISLYKPGLTEYPWWTGYPRFNGEKTVGITGKYPWIIEGIERTDLDTIDIFVYTCCSERRCGSKKEANQIEIPQMKWCPRTNECKVVNRVGKRYNLCGNEEECKDCWELIKKNRYDSEACCVRNWEYDWSYKNINFAQYADKNQIKLMFNNVYQTNVWQEDMRQKILTHEWNFIDGCGKGDVLKTPHKTIIGGINDVTRVADLKMDKNDGLIEMQMSDVDYANMGSVLNGIDFKN